MHIHAVVKRVGEHQNWTPVFVGTKSDPLYDERLTRDDKTDKLTQAHIMCLLDYNFSVLSRGFLVRQPGTKCAHPNSTEAYNNKVIAETIRPEIKILYGENDKCQMGI
jgi:hypothetical protein